MSELYSTATYSNSNVNNSNNNNTKSSSNHHHNHNNQNQNQTSNRPNSINFQQQQQHQSQYHKSASLSFDSSSQNHHQQPNPRFPINRNNSQQSPSNSQNFLHSFVQDYLMSPLLSHLTNTASIFNSQQPPETSTLLPPTSPTSSSSGSYPPRRNSTSSSSSTTSGTDKLTEILFRSSRKLFGGHHHSVITPSMTYDCPRNQFFGSPSDRQQQSFEEATTQLLANLALDSGASTSTVANLCAQPPPRARTESLNSNNQETPNLINKLLLFFMPAFGSNSTSGSATSPPSPIPNSKANNMDPSFEALNHLTSTTTMVGSKSAPSIPASIPEDNNQHSSIFPSLILNRMKHCPKASKLLDSEVTGPAHHQVPEVFAELLMNQWSQNLICEMKNRSEKCNNNKRSRSMSEVELSSIIRDGQQQEAQIGRNTTTTGSPNLTTTTTTTSNINNGFGGNCFRFQKNQQQQQNSVDSCGEDSNDDDDDEINDIYDDIYEQCYPILGSGGGGGGDQKRKVSNNNNKGQQQLQQQQTQISSSSPSFSPPSLPTSGGGGGCTNFDLVKNLFGGICQSVVVATTGEPLLAQHHHHLHQEPQQQQQQEQEDVDHLQDHFQLQELQLLPNNLKDEDSLVALQQDRQRRKEKQLRKNRRRKSRKARGGANGKSSSSSDESEFGFGFHQGGGGGGGGEGGFSSSSSSDSCASSLKGDEELSGDEVASSKGTQNQSANNFNCKGRGRKRGRKGRQQQSQQQQQQRALGQQQQYLDDEDEDDLELVFEFDNHHDHHHQSNQSPKKHQQQMSSPKSPKSPKTRNPIAYMLGLGGDSEEEFADEEFDDDGDDFAAACFDEIGGRRMSDLFAPTGLMLKSLICGGSGAGSRSRTSGNLICDNNNSTTQATPSSASSSTQLRPEPPKRKVTPFPSIPSSVKSLFTFDHCPFTSSSVNNKNCRTSSSSPSTSNHLDDQNQNHSIVLNNPSTSTSRTSSIDITPYESGYCSRADEGEYDDEDYQGRGTPLFYFVSSASPTADSCLTEEDIARNRALAEQEAKDVERNRVLVEDANRRWEEAMAKKEPEVVNNQEDQESGGGGDIFQLEDYDDYEQFHDAIEDEVDGFLSDGSDGQNQPNSSPLVAMMTTPTTTTTMLKSALKKKGGGNSNKDRKQQQQQQPLSVRFMVNAEDNSVPPTQVFHIDTNEEEQEASRQSRGTYWEHYALDRRRTADKWGAILEPVLAGEHRARIYRERFQEQE